MKNTQKDFIEGIGNTPLIKLRGPSELTGCNIYGKAEYLNPGGSSGVLMISTIPVMIIFFSWIFKIEKTNIYQILGVIFSLIGVAIIVTKADFDLLIKEKSLPLKIFCNKNINICRKYFHKTE